MKYNPEIHHRRSIRLKSYDYTIPGAYFVTICTYQRMHIFGEVVDGEMILNEAGKIARDAWFKTVELRPYVKLHEDEFVIMPNHAHGIIWIDGENVATLHGNTQQLRAEQRSTPTKTVAPGSLGAIIRGYKSAVTYAINGAENQRGAVLWQRNYYDHIIRNEREFNNIRWYIFNNPRNWELDRDNAQNVRKLSPPEQVQEYLKDLEVMVLKLRANHQ